jgi:hypothetical protein
MQESYEMQDAQTGEPCHDCEYWTEMIGRTNQELALLRQPLGLCSIPETVMHLDADAQLENPEPFEQRRAFEEKLRERVKRFTLSRLKHQREAHAATS